MSVLERHWMAPNMSSRGSRPRPYKMLLQSSSLAVSPRLFEFTDTSILDGTSKKFLDQIASRLFRNSASNTTASRSRPRFQKIETRALWQGSPNFHLAIEKILQHATSEGRIRYDRCFRKLGHGKRPLPTNRPPRGLLFLSI